MDTALLILGPLALLGWNALLLYWSRAYVRLAAVTMFALNLLVGSPLLGVLSWKLLSRDVTTSYATGLGEVFIAIGLCLFNALLALLGGIAAAARRTPDVAAEAGRARGRARRR